MTMTCPLASAGSPPHAWGHRRYQVPIGRSARFTPTRVGTSLKAVDIKASVTVHPHTRGDISIPDDPGRVILGSPPHAWGHLQTEQDSLAQQRFTPTRVGTSRSATRPQRSASVHPHTRGDISGPTTTSPPPVGSPPHAWGHRELIDVTVEEWRFTPTRVGTSAIRPRQATASSVHPHTRGDILLGVAVQIGLSGSPPHAWGHQHPEAHSAGGQRFTPTRVGTSLADLPGHRAISVHPHTRGDI